VGKHSPALRKRKKKTLFKWSRGQAGKKKNERQSKREGGEKYKDFQQRRRNRGR